MHRAARSSITRHSSKDHKSNFNKTSFTKGKMNYPVWALVIGSILSSVCLVVVNKMVFKYGFPYVFTLSTFHFIVTSSILQIMSKVFKLFETVYLPFWMNMKVATFGVGSIALMNFSLKYNSIGFYQMSKLCIVPVCLIINALQYGEYARRKELGALIFVLSGVGIANFTDIDVNITGTIFGVFAVLTTAQFQIWQGKKQKEYKISGMQLANSVSLFQIFVGGLVAILLEADKIVTNFQVMGDIVASDDGDAIQIPEGENNKSMTNHLAGLIFLSCLLAVSVNVHSFALIGKTSAVTFQVVGHGKTCLILTSGYFTLLSEGHALSDLYVNILGVTIALFGVILYSNLKLNGTEGKDWLDKFLPSSILKIFEPELRKKDYHPVDQSDEIDEVNTDLELQERERK